jgi:hypothetical protein
MNMTFPYWFAIILSVGTLIFYLLTSLWSRNRIEALDGSGESDFDLGIPKTDDRASLFAIALVAAGTSLSTVFVFFLTAGAFYGWWLLLSPLMFLVGNAVMFWVYGRMKLNGYTVEANSDPAGATGLVPFLATKLTGSRGVGLGILLLSLLNLVAVFVLELVVCVEVVSYLTDHAFGGAASDSARFIIFAVSLALMLGYVYVGGFRAVIASDVWQMKLMKGAVFLTAVSLLVVIVMRPEPVDFSSLGNPPLALLWGFILNVVLANIFVPMSQESSWQRFRAFSAGGSFDAGLALRRSLRSALFLWGLLIASSFLLILALPSGGVGQLTSMSGVLEQLKGINDSVFALLLFPLMVVAGLSAMFSTADTCVSSILFLLQFLVSKDKAQAEAALQKPVRLHLSYHLAMAILFGFSLLVYAFVRFWFEPSILQLVFSVFSNLVVVAPVMLTAVILKPVSKVNSKRTGWVTTSLIVGFVCYWSTSLFAMIKGADYLWLSQLSILAGLAGALLPVLPLWFSKGDRSYAGL